MHKLGILSKNEDMEYRYKNEYAIQKTTGSDRLIISTSRSFTKLAYDLIEDVTDSFWLLYVLVVPRSDNKAGRYQLDDILTRKDLKVFLEKYSNYFESDGRHHIWVGSTNSNDLIVYDNHNVLYVYGDSDKYLEKMKTKEFKRVNEIVFPCPHSHNYNHENDNTENELIESYKWKYFSLEESD